MTPLLSWLVALSIGAPLLTALFGLIRRPEHGRRLAVSAASISLVCSALLVYAAESQPGPLESAAGLSGVLSTAAMTLFSLLAVATVLLSPNRDLEQRRMPGLMLILAGTLGAYAATSLGFLLMGWALSVLPHSLRWFSSAEFSARERPTRSWAPQVILGASTVCLAIGAGMLEWFPAPGLGELRGFVFLILAALLRKGVFPFHSWVARAHEDGTPLAAALLLNGHLGALLTLRFIIPRLSEASRVALPLLSDLALFTAVYVSLLAMVERKPRRILAFLSVSQAAFILAGLENRSATGITGALLLWPVVALTTTGLVAVYSAVEARFKDAENPRDFLGLGARTPRLAVFFAASGLALAGIPGTLGFVAEDLLFHGALEANALLGVALPLATALNAITTFRLFAKLFLGRKASLIPSMPDSLARERWALTVSLAALVAAGLFPHVVVDSVAPMAQAISNILMR